MEYLPGNLDALNSGHFEIEISCIVKTLQRLMICNVVIYVQDPVQAVTPELRGTLAFVLFVAMDTK